MRRWSHEQEIKQVFTRSPRTCCAHATGGDYVNFMPEDETQRVAAGAYGPNYALLASLKAKYDPTNPFRLNQNIAPED